MATADTQSEQVFVALRALKSAWPMGGWSWDSRMSTVASSFAAHHAPAARAAVQEGLPTAWTVDNILSAPSRVRALGARYDGVRKGQLLAVGGDVDALLAFGLWWPWESSETISLRVGFADLDQSHRHYVRLFEIFGVSP